jgi:hypothetical protein
MAMEAVGDGGVGWVYGEVASSPSYHTAPAVMVIIVMVVMIVVVVGVGDIHAIPREAGVFI